MYKLFFLVNAFLIVFSNKANADDGDQYIALQGAKWEMVSLRCVWWSEYNASKVNNRSKNLKMSFTVEKTSQRQSRLEVRTNEYTQTYPQMWDFDYAPLTTSSLNKRTAMNCNIACGDSFTYSYNNRTQLLEIVVQRPHHTPFSVCTGDTPEMLGIGAEKQYLQFKRVSGN